MSKASMEEYKQLEGCVLITVFIVCHKCERIARKKFIESSDYAIKGFYKTGWRAKGRITYCPVCRVKLRIK